MIRTVNLSKKYDEFWTVRDVALDLRDGEIYGFLGPNGAGKTTTILMLLGIVQPTAGDIFLFGERTKGRWEDLRRRIGVVSERQYFYPEMILREYLDFFGALYGVGQRAKRIELLLERTDLTDAADKQLRTFSRGMQQKAGFLRALLHDPDLLILDEPVSGLDPMGVRQIRALIKDANSAGKTVLISSHLLSEVEKLCHRAGILRRGQLIAEDDMSNLLTKAGGNIAIHLEFLEEEADRAAEILKDIEWIESVAASGRFLYVNVKTDRDYRKDVVQCLVTEGFVPVGLHLKSVSLEDAFVSLTRAGNADSGSHGGA